VSTKPKELVFICLLCTGDYTFEQMEEMSKEYPKAIVSVTTDCPDCNPTMEWRKNEHTDN